MISLIKEFNSNISDLLELSIYIFNKKSRWFLNQKSKLVLNRHSGNFQKQPAVLDQIEQSRLRKIKVGHYINFELHGIHKIDGALIRKFVERTKR